MAVQAKHLNLLTTQPIQNSEQRQMHFSGIPMAGASPEKQMNFYQAVVCEAKTSDRDSGVTTYNNQIAPITRKRSRNELYAAPNLRKGNSVSNISSYVGDDFFQQYHLDIDTIISQHTKKIRMELQERQMQQTRLLVAAIGEGAMKKLKEKDEEIQKLGKLNYVLHERVKSLYVENQVWREVAQTNEAAANNLRANLEQALAAHIRGDATEDDVESCCGSSDHDGVQDKDIIGDGERRWWCRRCGERESCVLLLPCRHLCLCNVCGSGAHQLRACPVCHSSMNATLHVNLSS